MKIYEIIIKKKLFIFIMLPASALIIFLLVLCCYSFSSIDRNNTTVDVEIPTGTSFFRATEILKKAGLVKNRFLFYSLAIAKRARRLIRAGEYEFSTSMTPSALMDKLLHGDTKKYPVTIPEDYTMEQIAARLLKDKLISENDFFDLAEDQAFIRSLGINAETLEGYLFPETYNLERSMTTRQILRMMVNQFWKKVTPEMIAKAAAMGLSTHQFVTLASMVGKESSVSSEKPLISAVFHNRLKKGMRLQSDPTAVYDLENFKGKVLRSHLKRNSPYNTYVISGLPPGPIANPGLDSLKATLEPEAVNYLYFVSKGDGSHFFSASMDMHIEAISRFRNTRIKSNK